MKFFLIFLSILTLLTIATGVAAMMFFGNKDREVIDIVLMSPLEGVLTYNGKPLPKQEMKLWLKWKDKKGEHFTYVTDEEGRFAIPEHKVRDSLNPFAQLVIRQELTTQINGNEYEVWVGSKKRPELFAELAGQPVDVICDIATEYSIVEGNRSIARTVCIWSSLIN